MRNQQHLDIEREPGGLEKPADSHKSITAERLESALRVLELQRQQGTNRTVEGDPDQMPPVKKPEQVHWHLIGRREIPPVADHDIGVMQAVQRTQNRLQTV